MDNNEMNKIIQNELNKFGNKTVRELKGTLPVRTGRLVSELDYELTDNNLSLFSTYYFKYVLAKYSPRSQKVIADNIDDLTKNLGDALVNEIVIKLDNINIRNLI